MAGPSAWWLRLPGEKRVRVSAAGVVFGRSPRCDVVLADVRASRQHAIVFAGPRGARIVPLGRGATSVGGEPIDHDRELAHGDRIELPGLEVIVAAEGEVAAAETSTWVLEWRDGGAFGVVSTPFTIGGGGDVDLRVGDWPAHVMRFHAGERLQIEALEPIAIDGIDAEPGDVEPIGPGSIITYGAAELRVIAGGMLAETSTVSDAALSVDDLPSRVRVEFMPRGGRLTVTWRGRDRTVYLADRRCDLIAALLQPPAPYAPGDYVPDDVVIPRVWPGRDSGRPELNVLIHRTRRDLVRADLAGAALLGRAPGGNATRFLLAPGAAIALE